MPQPRKKPAAKPRTSRAKKPETPAAVDQQAFEKLATEVLERAAARVVPEPAQGGELVVRLDDPQNDVFRVMDAYDEAQILDELEGRPSKKMVYSFDGNAGLSYSGVSEAVRTLNSRGLTQIRVAKDVTPMLREVTETDENGETITYVEVLVYGEDLARQQKFQTFRDKTKTPKLDKFATTKALSKAQRNAQLELIPMMFREILIALAQQDPRTVQVLRSGMPSTADAQLGAPLQDERAVELAEEIRVAYDEVKALPGGPRKMPPGKFNAKLTRARATDHKSMEELRDELRSLAEHLRGEKAA
jgi:hypothetical protein